MNTEQKNKNEMSYRPCVGIALFNNQGKVFVGERIDTPGAWQMPQGGVDPGETIEQTALRELGEEVGTNKASILEIAETKVRYDLPEHLALKFWNGQYRGQEQTWVAAKFTGNDDDIDINAFEPPEFSDWKWVDLPETIDLIVPFKRDIYQQVISFFKHIKV